jgi:hypothetical protein
VQRTILCASALAPFVLACAVFSAMAGSQPHGSMKKNASHQGEQPVKRHEQMPPRHVIGGSSSTDERRTPVVSAPVQAPQPFRVLPMAPQGQPQRLIYAGIEQVRPGHHAAPAPSMRPLRPLSFVPTDPNAVISRLPSGRIVMSPAPGAYVASPREVAYYKRLQNPYAPPAFHMIGAPSDRYMRRPVALTYGVQPSRRFNPAPKVIWVGAENRQDADHAHIRHVK